MILYILGGALFGMLLMYYGTYSQVKHYKVQAEELSVLLTVMRLEQTRKEFEEFTKKNTVVKLKVIK